MKRASILLLAIGCSSGSAATPPPAGDTGTVEDLGAEVADTASPCGPYAHPKDDGGCDSTLTWAKGDPFPSARDHHATFLDSTDKGTFVYVAGGNDYTSVFKDVWAASVEGDGTTLSWKTTTAFPSGRAGHGVVVDAHHVVITGGKQGSNLAEVLTSTVQPDGTLAPWVKGPPLPAPRFHHATVFAEGAIYVTGGLEVNQSVAKVHRAALSADGTLGSWTTLGDLPRPRSHHASFAYSGYLYVLGGLDGDPAADNTPLKDVSRAKIQDDGTLGEWTSVSSLPVALATHGALTFGKFAYVVGGIENDAKFTPNVRRAPLNDDGSMGAWQLLDPLPRGRGHVHHVPQWNGHLYSFGGSSSMGKVIADVMIGTFL